MNYPITLITICHNGESRLEKFLEFHKPLVSEIVVINQGSTDNTRAIADKLADIVVDRTKKGYCDADRQYAAMLASQPYVLYLDDDEFLSDELITALPDLLATPLDAFWFVRRNFIDGVDIKEVLGDDIQCRLWKRGAVRWPKEMHSFPAPADGVKVAYVQAPIDHIRSLQGMIDSNKAREPFASPDVVEMQNKFISAVTKVISEAKNV